MRKTKRKLAPPSLGEQIARIRMATIAGAEALAVANLPPIIAAGVPDGELTICASGDDFKIEAAADNADPKSPKKFTMTAYTGGLMNLRGWPAPVVVAIEANDKGEGMKTPRQSIPIDKDHVANAIVGHTDTLVKSKQRLKASGVISGHHDTEQTPSAVAAREVVHLAGGGFPWQASILAEPSRAKVDFLDKGQSANVNGLVCAGPCYVVWESTLRAISFVATGADDNTSASVAAAHSGDTDVNDQWIAAQGFDPKTLTEAQRKFLQAAYDAEQKAKAPPVVTPVQATQTVTTELTDADRIKARRAAEAGEDLRIAAIRKICAAQPDLEIEVDGPLGSKRKLNLQAHAIGEGWTTDQTELAVLRAARPAGPFGYVVTSEPAVTTEAVLEAAVLQAGQCRLWDNDFYLDEREKGGKERRVPERLQRETQRDLNARYTDQIMQAAHNRFRGRIGLQQLLIEAARANGYTGRGETINDGNLVHILRAQNWIRAEGSSTMSLGNVLANVLNKKMLEGYFFVEQAWREICAIVSVKDFKPTKSVNLFGDFLFQDVGSSGELKHGTLKDQAFPNQATTSGRILTIPRPIIINDDLSALTKVPMLMGRGAGLKLNKTFWTQWLGSATDDGGSTAFWAAVHTIAGQVGNSNYQSGGSTALSSDSLKAGQLLYDKQVDPIGDPLGLDAEILLYPVELDTPAWELLNSQNLVYGGGTAAKQGEKNRWVNKFRPVKSRYLSNANFTGYSTTAWWLLANPAVMAAIEVCFLNGQEAPTVQTAEADFDILGISMRGFFDFGATMQNFRAGIKSAGA
jgi:Spy/CpxP family protein refolding chaperone